MIEFYSDSTQPITPEIHLLPQKGSTSGGTGRPMNSYAILCDGWSVLVDAPYSWTMQGVRELAQGGYSPRAMILSHSDVVMSADALDAFIDEYGVPIFLHPADQDSPAATRSGVEFVDPIDHALIREARLELIPMPGHTPGSIMLHMAGGYLLTGDSAVAPGPEQSSEPPRLERPAMPDGGDRLFCERWRELFEERTFEVIMPLHGQIYTREELGRSVFDSAIKNIWMGDPMRPNG